MIDFASVREYSSEPPSWSGPDSETWLEVPGRAPWPGLGIGSRMADLAAGGAMGLSFTLLYEVIKEVVIKTAMFGPLLKELDFTIDSLKPLIDDMDKYNKVLDRPEKELREF
ncbi:hypothetical protein ACLB2K_003594 [Fragaria x ananassa]